ncbi:MAG: MFS transporter [Thermaerobacter sp.]|nr:MFS transporter [Thermaerobacter sp.]
MMLVAEHAPRRLRVSENLALSFFWFTSNAQWTALIIILGPAVIRQFVGDTQAGLVLSGLTAVGALIASVVQPLAGAISDRKVGSLGRRRPYMLVGVPATALLLWYMGAAPSIPLFAAAYFLLQVVANLAAAPYQALIPDLVVADQRGTASGYMGLMTQAAVIGGVVIASAFAIRTAFEVLALLQVLGLLVTVVGVREVPQRTAAAPFRWRAFLQSFWIPPREHSDWWWVFGTRLMVLLGFGTLEYYLNYYLVYVQHMKNPNGPLESILLLVTIGSLISVLTAGWLSDRLKRRKMMVRWGGLVMGLSALGFVFSHGMTQILVLSGLFGVGYGTYLSTDWALAVDVLPKGRDAAKDMGLWSISQTLSQTIATLIAGGLLAVLVSSAGLAMSYRVLYLVTFVYFLVGSLLITKVKSVR